jgi:hypothetical protein
MEIAIVINDNPEGQRLCGIYDSNLAQFPCRMCWVKQANLDNPVAGMAAAMRTAEDMETRRAEARPLPTKTARKDLLKKVSGLVICMATCTVIGMVIFMVLCMVTSIVISLAMWMATCTATCTVRARR